MLMLDYSNVRSKQVYSDLILITRRGRHSRHSRHSGIRDCYFLVRLSYASDNQSRALCKSESEESSKLNHSACFISAERMRGSSSILVQSLTPGASMRKARAFAVSIPRVRGKRANILSLR